jgi:hypothetical protein
VSAGTVFGRFLRLPALHFVLIGAALFAATLRVPAHSAPAEQAATRRAPIVIPAATIAELRAEHREITGAPPTAADLRTLIQGEVDHEILYREALLLGLDRADPAVEQRVVEKMRFLYGEDAGTDAEVYRRGMELGIQRDDIVVRRTLITRMQLLAKRASLAQEPEGAELERALAEQLAAHSARYRQPAAVDLEHVFFSADRRGAAAAADAAAWRRQHGSTPPSDTGVRGGDVFALGAAFHGQSERALAKIFGPDFAATVINLESGRWSAPVRSSYGVHLVWVTGKEAARVPALADVRARVLRAYRAERHAAYLDELMPTLRGMYEVRIAPLTALPQADG